jgi:ABC-type multidrug transport system ATPase subunit
MSGSAVIAAFDLYDVCKQFGDLTALDHLSIVFGTGRRHALLGPNGSGKTTLLRVLAGRTTVDSGEARRMGVSLRKSTTQCHPGVRYLTQHFSLYGELTVCENLAFAADMRGESDDPQAVELALHDFDLLSVRSRRAETLSSGVQQRLMLATVLLGEPRLLLLDEPTAALDPNARQSLWRLLDRQRTPSTTLILTTHLDEDIAHCDTATHLRDGRIDCIDPPGATH